jgi:predicted deacetylase
MKSSYIFRLDDACPTMDHLKWTRLEAIFEKHEIRPLVAIIPDNVDPELHFCENDPKFWDRARKWKSKGWTIAMHGYQHRFHTVDRKKLILPFYNRSEFGGLSFSEQLSKIEASWLIFQRECVIPSVWIAPAHCFDRTTLKALKAATTIRIVSDGIAFDQYYEHEFYWLPQQLWSFSEKNNGTWTICLHPNTMDDSQFEKIELLLCTEKYRSRFTTVDSITFYRRPRNLNDMVYSFWFWRKSKLFKIAAYIKRGLFIIYFLA